MLSILCVNSNLMKSLFCNLNMNQMFKTNKLTTCLAALVAFLPIGKAMAQNLIQNGDFSAQPANQWTFVAPATSIEANYPESTYGGTSTTNIVAEIDAASNLRQTNIAVAPGVKYYFSYLRSRRTGNGAAPNPNYVNVKIYDGATVYVNRTDTAANAAFTWLCALDSFTATGNTVTIEFTNTNTSSTLGTLVDNITIVPEYVPVHINGVVCQGNNFRMSLPLQNSNNTFSNFQWTHPNTLVTTDSFVDIVNANPANHNGTYTCEFNMNTPCLRVKATFNLVVNPTSDSSFHYICDGDSIPYFNTFIKTAGIYDTTLKSINGCDSILTTVVTVIPKPVKIMMPDSLIVCQYDSVAFESYTLPHNNSYTYSWFPSNNLNATNEPNVWFSADESRRYTLTVTYTGVIPCSLRDTLDVIVNPGNFLQLAKTDFSICPGDSILFMASGAQAYKWTSGLYLNSTTIGNPVAKPETSIDYVLVGTSDKNCHDTQMVHVTVHPNAVLELPDYVHLYAGETYFMQPATNAVYFKWFPDAGLNDTKIANPKMNPRVNTRYFVSAQTEYGCTVSDSVDVYVKETVLGMPNAFNPNSERFKASIRGVASLESFAIYNRWGQKIYESKELSDGWDGNFRGTPQPVGVYVYSIQATTIEGKPFKQSGNVTLLR